MSASDAQQPPATGGSAGPGTPAGPFGGDRSGRQSGHGPRMRRGRRTAPMVEVGLVFLVAAAVIAAGWLVVGDDAFARQVVVWVANVIMLVMIRIGLGRRGETFEAFGLRLRFQGWRFLAWTIVQSLVVLLLALAAFGAGAVLFRGAAESGGADMSGYSWLQGNLPLFLLALVAVWIVSSFGEEVVYRGFLMNRVAEAGGDSGLAWFAAVLVSAIVFGLAHFGWGFVGIVQTTFMGLALALSYVVLKRNLLALVLAHVLLDTLLLAQLYTGAPAVGGG